MTATLHPGPPLLLEILTSASGLDVRPDVPAAVAVETHDIVEEWGMQSFPASDPPANW